MMKRVLGSRFWVLGLFLLWGNCYAQAISSTELINNAKSYDGQAVTYTGEVIGDVMVRGEFAWVNLSDGVNAIGIWLERPSAGQIEFSGSHKSEGDRVEVTGIFHRACPQHGGDLDIHATAIKKLSSGRKVSEKLNSRRLNQSLILSGALILAWILTLLKYRPKKR